MKKRIWGIFGGISLLFYSTFLYSESLQIQTLGSKSIQSLIEKMTPQEKIGQLLMVGIHGKHMTSQTVHLIQELKIGGVILYSENIGEPSQVREFTGELQELSSQVPLFISIDQEGGSVARLKTAVTVLPSAMALGAAGSSQFSFLAGKVTGHDLSSMGINMNLAPVLDVLTEYENHLIGLRSFGDNPELVSQLGMWYVEGLQSSGVIATAKHFPGHGDTLEDSHYVIPVLNRDLAEIENFQLVPFQRAIDNGLDAIMTAHISIPSLDSSGLPATLSYNVLTNMVRKKMNFKGIVVTDDLEMKSILKRYDIGEASVKAILAGADVVMIGWTDQRKRVAYEALLKAYQEGKISEKRIRESLERILTLKLKRGFFDLSRTPAEKSDEELSHPIHQKLADEIAAKAITLVQNSSEVLPLEQDDPRKVLLVTPLFNFYTQLKFFHENVSPVFISVRPTVSELKEKISDIVEKSSKYDLLIFGITHHSQIDFVKEVSEKVNIPIVAISFGSPYYLKKFASLSSYLCSYGTQKELISATAKVLTGLVKPQGKLPVSLENNLSSFKRRGMLKKVSVR